MRTAIPAIIAALLIGGYYAWFFTTHEREEREVYVGYRGEAAYNHYLAADRLLNALEIEAESRESFRPTQWLPPGSDTVVMQLSAGVSVGEEFDALVSWVYDYGGHLVVLPPPESTQGTDDFMAYFGLAFEKLSSEDMDAAAGLDDPDDASDDEPADDGEPADGADADYDYTVSLWLVPYRVSTDRTDGFTTLSDDFGNIAVRVAEGNGYVTALGSTSFFDNENIDESDHGRLFLDVVAGYLEPGKVWLIFEAEFPSLWRIIWASAPFLILSLVIMFLTWLWATMPRFGPKVVAVADERRSIREHVSAAGSFVWRNDGAHELGASVVRALLHEAERRHPGIGRMPPEKQAEALAHLTGMSTQSVFDAMMSAGEGKPREFTENIQRLQNIRKAL